jgi:membrane-bound ClpP family serine protease
MKCSDMTDVALVGFLREHPDLRNRVASIALAVENTDGALGEADAAEERLVEEMQHLGREALKEWAKKRVEVTEQEIRQQASMHRQGKKNSAGIRSSAR